MNPDLKAGIFVAPPTAAPRARVPLESSIARDYAEILEQVNPKEARSFVASRVNVSAVLGTLRPPLSSFSCHIILTFQMFWYNEMCGEVNLEHECHVCRRPIQCSRRGWDIEIRCGRASGAYEYKTCVDFPFAVRRLPIPSYNCTGSKEAMIRG